ncbi:MAG: hypothetical protein HYX78_02495 [Armatimonadetes bacterium]|nr:hypothetical protein [Armatimonadota bacterium]
MRSFLVCIASCVVLSATGTIYAASEPDISSLALQRIPIETRQDKPVPSYVPEVDGVLFDGFFYADVANHPTLKPGDKAYTPIREGGFFIQDGPRYFNRPIFRMGNMLSTGDRPMFLIHRSFSSQWCSKLRFSFSRGDKAKWLDEFQSVYAEFWPGSTNYVCNDSELGLEVKLAAVAADLGWTSLFELAVTGPGAKDARVHWVFGDVESFQGHKDWMFWLPELKVDEEQTNEVTEIEPGIYRVFVDPSKHENWKKMHGYMGIQNMEFYAGSKWPGQRLGLVNSQSVSTPLIDVKPVSGGKLIACNAPVSDGWKGTMAVAWGGKPNNYSGHEEAMRRLNIPWGMKIYPEWYESYVGRGSRSLDTFRQVMASPEKAMADAREFWGKIRKRVVVDTPDDMITAWANWLTASQEYLHWLAGQIDGIDSWGLAYLHISNMYDGWDYCGVHDQQEKWLRIFASSVRKGWIGLYHGTAPWVASQNRANAGAETQIAHYLNCAYSHWLWTGNDQFVKDIWPFIKPLIERELMQNDPDGDGLFVSRQSDWAPEDDSFGPKSQLETAQALRALKGCAEFARVAGDIEAEKQYSAYIRKIKRSLPSLWDTATGLMGYRGPDDVLKLNPGAMEIFYPILRGVVDQLQAYQMLRYAREILWASDERYPDVARIIMCPHHVGKTGLGPLTDMSWRTVAAAAVTGDMDNFWPVFRTFANAYFFSSWPGGETCGVTACGSGHAGMNDHNDGRMPALYALGRGLFGLEPDVPRGRITIEPHFPSEWKKASISQPSVSYTYEAKGDTIQMQVSTPNSLAKTLRIPINRAAAGVEVDGKAVKFKVEAGVNRALVVVNVPKGAKNMVTVELIGSLLQANYQRDLALGVPFKVTVQAAEKLELVDPQKAVKVAGQTANQLELVPVRTGSRTAFLKANTGNITAYLPLDLNVSAEFAIAETALDTASGKLTFKLKNPGRRTGAVNAGVKTAGVTHDTVVSLSPQNDSRVEVRLSPAALASITPGSNPVQVQIGGSTFNDKFVNWDVCGPDRESFLNRMVMLDLVWDYNEEAVDLFNTKFFYDAWIMGIDNYAVTPSKTYEYGGIQLGNPKPDSPYFLAAGKIPFFVTDEKSLGGMWQPHIGGGPRNVLVVANWRPHIYPSNLVIPTNGMRLSKVYFLAYSWYRAHQSHYPCVELVAKYKDGSKDVRQLIPPFSFNPLYARKSINRNPYHIEVIQSGLSTGNLGTDIVDVPVDPTKPVESIEVRSVTSESLFAIFGITLVKAE